MPLPTLFPCTNAATNDTDPRERHVRARPRPGAKTYVDRRVRGSCLSPLAATTDRLLLRALAGHNEPPHHGSRRPARALWFWGAAAARPSDFGSETSPRQQGARRRCAPGPDGKATP